MENSDQVCEQCLPDAEFKLVHEVNDHHLGNIETLSRQLESLMERVLPHAQSVRELAANGDLAHNGWHGGCCLE